MSIQVSRYGGSLGIFTEEEIRAGLATGQFVLTDTGLAEGMTETKPLSDFPQFAPSPIPDVAPPPMQPAGLPIVAAPSVETVLPPTGLPWENRTEKGFFEAFFQTVITVLTKPTEAFDLMRKEGGLWDPLLFALLGGSAGFIANFLFSFMLNGLGFVSDRHSALGALVGAGVGGLMIVIMTPIFLLAGAFIGAAIVHVCLLLVGGANKPYETTFRVLCFSTGSSHLLMLVPICGGFIASIWGLVVNCVGLARAHNTDTWRAVLAIFLPMLICCGGIAFFVIFFGALGAFGLHHQH